MAPVGPSDAAGPVAEAYRLVKAELGVIGPAITMLSPAPELLAPVWSLLGGRPGGAPGDGGGHGVVHLLTFGAMTAVDALQDEIETRNVDA